MRAAVTATGIIAATVAAGLASLHAVRAFWLGGVFTTRAGSAIRRTPGPVAGRGDSPAGAGTGDPPRTWWLVAVLVTGLAGLTVAVWAHRRGHRLAGTVCCAITGLLISPVSWTHHWVWAVPLLVWLTAAAWRCRSVACGLAATAGAAVFSGFFSIPSAGVPGPAES